MNDDLVDQLVPDKSLGIRTSPSIAKIAIIGIALIAVAFIGYTVYQKTRPEAPEPVLNLGGSLPKPVPAPNVVVNAPVQQPNLPITNQAAVNNSSMPATPQVASQPIPNAQIATGNQVPITNTVQTAPVIPVKQEVKPAEKMIAQSKPITAEDLAKATVEVEKVSLVKSPVIHKKMIAKHKAPVRKQLDSSPETKIAKGSALEAPNNLATHQEEGVSREEIIVIQ